MEHIHNPLVFIVEDNELYSLILEYKLSNDSIIKCMCFKTGEECLENLELNPMLIILDYWLPGINGRETYKQIKKRKPDIPVVILTRNKDKDIEKELLKDGAYGYLNKEEDSIQQVKNIINTVVDEVIKKEEKRLSRIKLILILLLLAAVLITAIYLS